MGGRDKTVCETVIGLVARRQIEVVVEAVRVARKVEEEHSATDITTGIPFESVRPVLGMAVPRKLVGVYRLHWKVRLQLAIFAQ